MRAGNQAGDVAAMYAILTAVAQTLPVTAVSIVIGLRENGDAITMGAQVHVDATQRPDVRDLLRVHAENGDGHGSGLWDSQIEAALYLDGESLIGLLFEFIEPVSCLVPIVLKLPEHKRAIKAMLDSGRLIIDLEPPRPGEYDVTSAFSPGVLALDLPEAGQGVLRSIYRVLCAA